jgi:hypothetical protein
MRCAAVTGSGDVGLAAAKRTLGFSAPQFEARAVRDNLSTNIDVALSVASEHHSVALILVQGNYQLSDIDDTTVGEYPGDGLAVNPPSGTPPSGTPTIGSGLVHLSPPCGSTVGVGLIVIDTTLAAGRVDLTRARVGIAREGRVDREDCPVAWGWRWSISTKRWRDENQDQQSRDGGQDE